MTQPRRHIAGQVVHLSRRCFQRKFFLRPDNCINRVLFYETARASKRHGQVVHASMAMSNHIHQVSTDTTGERSAFMRDAMREISRARNQNLRRRDSLWDGRPFGDTVLLDRDAIARNLLYVWLNPVEAGLVRRAQEWPGFKILPRHWGKTLRIKKSESYYGRNSPEYVEFTPMPPPGYDDMNLEEVREHFEKLLREAEDEIRKARRNKKVRGPVRVCRTNPFSCPQTPSPMGTLSPRFASKNGELLSTAKSLHRQFQDTYQRQRLRWLNGETAIFPCGTVQLKRCAPIRCKPPDDDEPGLFELKRSLG
jgi:putative transposase